MRKIEIEIKEFELDDNLEPTAVKRFRTQSLIASEDVDGFIPYVCDSKCNEIKEFFLKERNNIPFAKIRREDENKSEN